MWSLTAEAWTKKRWLGGCFKDVYSYPYVEKWSNLTCAYFSDRLVQPPTRVMSIPSWRIWKKSSQPSLPASPGGLFQWGFLSNPSYPSATTSNNTTTHLCTRGVVGIGMSWQPVVPVVPLTMFLLFDETKNQNSWTKTAWQFHGTSMEASKNEKHGTLNLKFIFELWKGKSSASHCLTWPMGLHI